MTDHNIKILSAVSKNGVIGFNGRMPWKVPSEMQYFKRTTTGNIVIMGNSTFKSTGKLKDRFNIIMTQGEYTYLPGETAVFANTIDDCFNRIKEMNNITNIYKNSQIYVIGGEQIYRLFEPHVDEIILSEIPIEIEGDAYFPIDVKDSNKWQLDFVEYRIDYTLRKYKRI